MARYYTDPSTGQRVKIQKTHKFRNFVVLPAVGFIALGVMISAANGSGTAPTGPTPAAESSTSNSSTLDVAGEGQAMVAVMSNGHSANTVQLPHSQQLPDGFVSVTVSRAPSVESFQSGGQGDSGTISCTITRDGKVVDTQTASGQFASVSCSKSY